MRVCALVSDLMDRSKISSAIAGVEFVRDAAACAGADVVIVDLAKSAAIGRARCATRRRRGGIVGFGPHVDEDRARAAAGADLAPTPSRAARASDRRLSPLTRGPEVEAA